MGCVAEDRKFTIYPAEPDVENGLRLVALLFAKIVELEERVEALEERERVRTDAMSG